MKYPKHMEYPPLYKIDFTQRPRAYEKYMRLKKIVQHAADALRDMGATYESAELHDFMRGTGGFTRPHTPYYVYLDRQEYEHLFQGLHDRLVREVPGANNDISFVRYYGSWT